MKKVSKMSQETISWDPFNRGLRPKDRPAFIQTCNSAEANINEEIANQCLLTSESLFLGASFDREKQIKELEDEITKLEMKFS